MRDAKIVITRKTNSSISTFRQLYGISLAQFLEPVFKEENNIVIKGFISSRGLPSRQHQHFFVNNRFIAYNDVHRTIDALFAQSSFPTRINDDFEFVSGIESSVDQRQRKSMGKYPVYLLQLTCATTDYDICLDPAKNIVEFENWERILGLVSSLITDFLIKHKFMEDSSLSDDDDTICEDPDGRHENQSKLRFDELTHIKSSGAKKNLFTDEELKGGRQKLSELPGELPREQSQQISATVELGTSAVETPQSLRTAMNEYAKWTDPITKETFYVDKRTGNS
jgi:DNA mismatch repair ATPase MutL